MMNMRLLIAFAILFGLSVCAFSYACDFVSGFDRNAQQVFESLPMGISLDDASARLGSFSIRDASECYLPQRHSFEAEFERAESSQAVRFYLYQNGANWYYCLGFDAEGKLVVKVEGCS